MFGFYNTRREFVLLVKAITENPTTLQVRTIFAVVTSISHISTRNGQMVYCCETNRELLEKLIVTTMGNVG